MRSRGVTVFLEPKAQYNSAESASVIPEDFEVPFGKARIRREGTDATLITYGNTLHFALNVAERIQKDLGKSIEVIDLRSLVPWDEETVYASIRKTSKALIVHEDRVFGASVQSSRLRSPRRPSVIWMPPSSVSGHSPRP